MPASNSTNRSSCHVELDTYAYYDACSRYVTARYFHECLLQEDHDRGITPTETPLLDSLARLQCHWSKKASRAGKSLTRAQRREAAYELARKLPLLDGLGPVSLGEIARGQSVLLAPEGFIGRSSAVDVSPQCYKLTFSNERFNLAEFTDSHEKPCLQANGLETYSGGEIVEAVSSVLAMASPLLA